MNQQEEIKFIASRYKRGMFVADKGWNRIGISPISTWKRYRMVAAIGGILFLSASAAFIYHNVSNDNEATPVETKAVNQSPDTIVKVIDFENSPLPEVIESIKSTYGVEIENIPENAGDFYLSLHYEGNAIDLVSTINEILDTQMSVTNPKSVTSLKSVKE